MYAACMWNLPAHMPPSLFCRACAANLDRDSSTRSVETAEAAEATCAIRRQSRQLLQNQQPNWQQQQSPCFDGCHGAPLHKSTWSCNFICGRSSSAGVALFLSDCNVCGSREMGGCLPQYAAAFGCWGKRRCCDLASGWQPPKNPRSGQFAAMLCCCW